MANITRLDPLAQPFRMDPWKEFENMLRSWRLQPLADSASVPEFRMDMTEDERAYVVKADLPGVRKEDIKITIDNDLVTIAAETRRENEQKKGTAVYCERYVGRQERSFTLRHGVDETRAEASYKDGVLELTLPKKAVAMAKEVAVQ